MNIPTFLRDLLSTESKNWYFSQIPAAQTPQPELGKQIVINRDYVSIDIMSMRLVNVRTLFSTFYGVVNSFVTIDTSKGAKAEFNVVTTPSNLEKLDKKNLDKVITNNIPLLNELPYFGNAIKLELALCAVKSDDMARNMIDLFSTMSATAGVSFVSQAQPYTKFLAVGLEALTGKVGDLTIEIGLSTNFNSGNLLSGYYVVMGAPSEGINTNELVIKPNDYKLYYINGQPVKEYPYLIFKISGKESRENYFMIPEIAEATNKIFNLLAESKSTDAKEALKRLTLIVMTSRDLFPSDKVKIIEKVTTDANSILQYLEGPQFKSRSLAATGGIKIPTLDELNQKMRND
ncbi:MAG: hypothetical protein JWR09_5482 [Mucilaginibacter sp.]|nr:hypothetical protein [Mucilaginibacter sp.]